CNFTAKIAFDLKVALNVVAQLHHFVIRKIFDAGICVNAGLVQNLDCAAVANTVNVGASDDDTLFTWNINARKTCHMDVVLFFMTKVFTTTSLPGNSTCCEELWWI